jgi:hypothetical protein
MIEHFCKNQATKMVSILLDNFEGVFVLEVVFGYSCNSVTLVLSAQGLLKFLK